MREKNEMTKWQRLSSHIDKLSDYINEHRKLRFLIDVIIVAIYVTVIGISLGFWLEGNDDNTFAYIVSGRLSEKPSPYLYYPNIVWGLFLSSLYRILPGVAWYGIVQFALIFMILLLSLHSIEQRCKSIISYCIVMCVSILMMLRAIKMLAFVQFTTLAALLAIAGYVCLIMYEKSSSKFVCFVFFEIVANLIREKAMLMIQPMGYTCFVAVSIMELFSSTDKQNIKSKLKETILRAGVVFASILVIFGVFRLADSFAYSDDEWREAMIIENFRTKINDRYYSPDYEEVKSILDKYDMDKYEYTAMIYSKTFDSDTLVGPADDIADYLVNKYNGNKNTLSVPDSIKWTLNVSYKEHWEILILTITLVMLVVLSDKPIMILALLPYVLGKFFTFGYMYYGQKIVDRVMNPLFYSELVFLLCMIFTTALQLYNKQERSHKIVGISFFVMLATFMLLVARDTRNLIIHSKEEALGYRVWNEIANEFAQYCASREEDSFLVSGEITIYWKYPLISNGYSDKGNYTFLGGWFYTSPVAQEYIHAITEKENCYLIQTVDTTYDEINKDILVYCEEYFGETPKFDEKIDISIGEYAKAYKLK